MRRWALGSSLVLFLLGGCSHSSSPTAPTPAPTPSSPAVQAIRLTPLSGSLPATGGSIEIVVETVSLLPFAAAPNVTVSLSATAGNLSANEVTTDTTGHARVTWTGTSNATIAAHAGDLAASTSVTVTSSTPSPPAPTPAPSPGPSPGPAPSPAPAPSPSALIAEIFPSPHGTDLATPVFFNVRVYTLDGSATGALTYAWDFGDGTTSSEATPTHQYTHIADQVTVRLHVAAADGRTADAQVSFPVGAAPAPLVSVSMTASPTSIEKTETVTFRATANSNVTAGAVTGFAWTFGDGGTATGATASHAYASAGTFTATVTAMTASGATASASRTITVRPRPLTVSLSATQTAAAPNATFVVTAALSSLDPPAAGSTYQWDFNSDGTFDATTGTTGSASVAVNGPAGTKQTVTVKVTAPDGRTATNTVEVTVS